VLQPGPATLVRGHPSVDDIVLFDRSAGTRGFLDVRRELRGRAVAYAVTLPDGSADVVVRHSRHGGLLAPLTRDLFLPPTRAPGELATALRLRDAGVPTPEVLAWLTYPAGPLFRRADVATRLVADGRDLADALSAPERVRGADAPWIAAVGALLRALARAGARHPDLNIKNVLLAPPPDAPAAAPIAWVLDVDVVRFVDDGSAASVAAANWDRFARSMAKWERVHGLSIDDAELRALRALALDAR
jgi:hypothetical protein